MQMDIGTYTYTYIQCEWGNLQCVHITVIATRVFVAIGCERLIWPCCMTEIQHGGNI